jgi:predicted nuclease of restriction endonuclease-like (RecB) superfamily
LVPAPADSLHAELRALIASSRQRLAGAVNAELTRLYWNVGQRLRTEVLGGADRAKYGDQLINRVGDQLAQEFGRGFEAKNLRRMVQFAQTFPLPEIVATLSRQLSWSHFVNLLPLKTEPARQFYASQAATNTWSVRELRHQIERKAFERTELAALQAPTPVRAEPVEASHTTPALVFKDPYFLDFLGLRQGHDEADLEAAILRQLEAFILELGRGFAFVERQKRMVIELPPSASSCAPNPAANRWSCYKCTKTASPWPNTGPNCHPKRSWSKSCMPPCWKRVSGWRDAGCCWGTWMTSDLPLPRPVEMRGSPGDFEPTSDTIKVMTVKVSKGLVFPVVALPGVGDMAAKGEDEQETARVFYVAATRAMQRLVIGVTGRINHSENTKGTQ